MSKLAAYISAFRRTVTHHRPVHTHGHRPCDAKGQECTHKTLHWHDYMQFHWTLLYIIQIMSRGFLGTAFVSLLTASSMDNIGMMAAWSGLVSLAFCDLSAPLLRIVFSVSMHMWLPTSGASFMQLKYSLVCKSLSYNKCNSAKSYPNSRVDPCGVGLLMEASSRLWDIWSLS